MDPGKWTYIIVKFVYGTMVGTIVPYTSCFQDTEQSGFHVTILYILYMGSYTFHILYCCVLFKIPRLTTVYHTSMILDMLYTYWLMYGFLDNNLWKLETCWRCNVLIVKLHIDIVYLVGYNKTVYQIMHRMNNSNKSPLSFQKCFHILSWVCQGRG